MRWEAWLRRLRFPAACLGVSLAAGMLGTYWNIQKFLKRPSPAYTESAPPPGAEEVRLKTSDGETLGAWYFPAPKNAPTVVVLHGLGGSRSSSAPAAKFWAEFGCGALLVTLRCHGDSTGERHDLGFRCAPDVVAAVDFVRERRPDSPVVVQGISLGSASAIFAVDALQQRVAGYLFESPYRDLRTLILRRAETQTLPLFSGIFQGCSLFTTPLAAPNLHRIAPVDFIGRIPRVTPVWILIGEADTLTPPSDSEALFEEVVDHGRLVRFPDAGHVPLIHADPKRYRECISEFLFAVRRSVNGDKTAMTP